MQDRKFRVMIARFPGGMSEHPDSTNWVIETTLKVKADPRLEGPLVWFKSDTPITMVRNACVQDALAAGVDILVMIDSDMGPDRDAPGVKSPAPFWETSLEFFLRHWDKGPCVIAAPYCGPAPHENVYAFRWRNKNSNDPGPDFAYSLEQYTREEAAAMGGIQEAAALATGLIMIDMRVFTGFAHPTNGRKIALEPPYFYYEWTDPTESVKASTEDVTFTRDCSLLGAPNYCNWDAWALHHKLKGVGKPQVLTRASLTKKFVQVMEGRQPTVSPGSGPAKRLPVEPTVTTYPEATP